MKQVLLDGSMVLRTVDVVVKIKIDFYVNFGDDFVL